MPEVGLLEIQHYHECRVWFGFKYLSHYRPVGFTPHTKGDVWNEREIYRWEQVGKIHLMINVKEKWLELKKHGKWTVWVGSDTTIIYLIGKDKESCCFKVLIQPKLEL